MTRHSESRVAGAIERIVQGARLPGIVARDDLRRELQTHFDEVEARGDTPDQALLRFGHVQEVTRNFSQVYRWDFYSLYAIKLVVAFVTAGVAAEVVIALVHLRVVDSGVQLAPGFFYIYKVGIKIVLAMMAAWEICRKPHGMKRSVAALAVYCLLATWLQFSVFEGLHGWQPWHAPMMIAIGAVASRTSRNSLLRFPLMFIGFYSYLFASITTSASPRPLVAGALVVIWLITENLFLRLDRAFGGWFDIPMETSFIDVGHG